MKLTDELKIAINVALEEASHRTHEYASLEHLLYALAHDAETASVIRHCGADMRRLKSRLDQYLATQIEKRDPATGSEVIPTLAFQRVLRRAMNHALSADKEDVHGYNVLVAMYAEPESWAVQFLEEQGVSRLDVVSYISHGIARDGDDDGDEADGDESALAPRSPDYSDSDGDDGERSGGLEGEPTEDDGSVPQPGEPRRRGKSGDPKAPKALEAFALNLNREAKEGRIDPVIGRDSEVTRVLHILARRRRNNPLLVGEPGVGKTAIIEGLALRINSGDVPESFKDAVLYSLDMGALLAGTRYRGDFENRMKAVIKELTALPHAVLVIDEIHTLIGAGAASGGAMDASNLLKPALSAGRLRCIGMTTYQEYRSYFERDAALTRRFQKVTVEEPSNADTLKIIEGLKTKYEAHHEVTYSRAALDAAVELSNRYLWQRKQPDKSLDLLDEAGAAARIHKKPGARPTRIGRAEIEEVCASMAQIPPTRVTRDDRERLRTLESDLLSSIFGQDNAVKALAQAIKLNRAGLRPENKPIGSFLLTGPTGVGKTELAKQLARVLDMEFIRFDMSEYMERHTVSRLIGAPPGYVGFDQGGLLTEAINKSPHAVLLLDEIEKAHPDVFNLLLQVMDHGTLTDTNGRKADFRNCVILMTSNVGARDMERKPVGFGGEAGAPAGSDEKEYKLLFSPEFRNRLDARIAFAHLTPEIMGNIAGKFIAELAAQLKPKKVTIELTLAARKFLADKGYDRQFGARPMARVVQDLVNKPLAEELLFGRLANGGHVKIDLNAPGEGLVFDFGDVTAMA